MSKEQEKSTESEQVIAILAREWSIIVEANFSQLNEQCPVGPNNTAWIDQLVRRYGIGHMNDITRAVDLLAPTVWRRRHQLIVQTLDALNGDQLQAILATRSFAAYFGKELTSKEKCEALQWMEWKISMLLRGQTQTKQVQPVQTSL